MRLIFHKYTSKFIFPVLSFGFILSCVPKHKFDFEKNQLSEKKMASVLSDVFLMESYINEKMIGSSPDSMSVIKLLFYKKILAKHRIDSVSFYTTFNYLQAHPKEMLTVIQQVDSTLNKIKPGDSTIIHRSIPVPENIDKLSGFREQEKVMRGEYLKTLMKKNIDSLSK
jgi:hypothetical protein